MRGRPTIAANSGRAGSAAEDATSTGITLLGVLLGVACTVALGITAGWWVRLVCGTAVFASLLLAIRLGSRPGRGAIARLAAWTMRRGGR